MHLQYKPFKKQELQQALAVLLTGNPLLQTFYQKVKAKLRKQANNPFKRYPYRRFRQEFFNAIADKSSEMYGVKIPREIIEKAQAVKALENRFFSAYLNLLRKLAHRWWHRTRQSTYLDLDDLINEGFIGLSDAIFGYIRPNIKFITYAYRAINNRMSTAVNKARVNFPWPRSLRKLFQKYEEATAQSQGLSMDQVFDICGFTPEQREQLKIGLIEVVPASTIEISNSPDDESEVEINDYTAHSKHFTRFRPVETLEPDQREAIASANLNEWEQAVLEGFLSGHWGWKAQVAAQFGKSRMMPLLTLRKIKEKILRRLEVA